ncbi:MAG TPA: radical SAM protein [Myxococcales bacterium]|nr:radical SAM protein [Myxococcales bacterium]
MDKPRYPRRLNVLTEPPHPAYVVWELTLRCDQPCTHCGSRAGDARTSELSTAEALDVVKQLAAMKTREVTLIGGEAYLHDGFLDVVAAVKAAGIRPSMTTGGRGVTAELARAAAKAGLFAASVSVDGIGETHDLIRAAPGSFETATAALGHLKAAGIKTASNMQINRMNKDEIEAVYEHLKAQGIQGWQVQLTAALGRAADRPELLLQPWDLLDVVPRVAALKKRAFADGILIMPANNLGYYGVEETVLRSVHEGGKDHFHGCQAGKFSLGIESDGAVKGCPSLQTSHYVGGNVREKSVQEIWDGTPELAFTRGRGVEGLWGFCRTCEFAEHCLAGCTFTAHALFGRPGNNPYCHFRARTYARQGLRERLVPVERAPGQPFDNGRFEILLEPFDAPDPAPAKRERRLRVWQG